MKYDGPSEWGGYSGSGYMTSGSIRLSVNSDYSGSPTMISYRGSPAQYSPALPDLDSLVDQLWKKMFDKPAIIPCVHCNSHNAYTNPVCVSCGAPMGNSSTAIKELK